MKRLLLLLFFIPLISLAQVPQGVGYQGVATDANGIELVNQSISIRASILSASANGVVEWEETHATTTDTFGLFALTIGEGTSTGNGAQLSFADISWGTNTHFLKIEMDVTGGANYSFMGTNQMMSVPYALYAENSANPGPQGPIGATGPQGPIGATGPQGLPGQDGVDGNDGAPGIDGTDGMDVLGTANQTLYHNGTDWIATSNLSNDGVTATTDADMYINEITVGRGGGNMNYNTASGYQALNSNTTGVGNTALGWSSLLDNTTGIDNTAIGISTLKHNNGTGNTATGRTALKSSTTGSYNTATGISSMYYNTTGDFNTAIGNASMFYNTTGTANTATGSNALESNTTGVDNTAIGAVALKSNTTGSYNTAIGQSAGWTTTGGNNNITIGYNAHVPYVGDNQVRIGNTMITYAGIQVGWTITSDKHWKSDIQNSNLGLNFISKIRPVSYYRNNDESKKIEYGFIAQELEEVLNSEGVKNNGIISKDNEGMYGIRYNDLMAPMVKAIQEQQEIIESLKERITQLENK